MTLEKKQIEPSAPLLASSELHKQMKALTLYPPLLSDTDNSEEITEI